MSLSCKYSLLYHTHLCRAASPPPPPSSPRCGSGLRPAGAAAHTVQVQCEGSSPPSHPELPLLGEVSIKPSLGVVHVSKFNG